MRTLVSHRASVEAMELVPGEARVIREKPATGDGLTGVVCATGP